MKIYLVGGAIRDSLLGLAVTERDWVVVGARAEDMLALGYQQVGKDFPVFLHPHTKEEYALARTERKTAPGYGGFAVHADPGVTLEQDLQRRDLTINAMAQAADGTLIDPFNGQEDLRLGILRHVSPAFIEDPVRVLRVARFAARFDPLGFRVAHATNALMREMSANGEVDALVAERVWKELARALEEPAPARFFEVLHGCGALMRIFPELSSLFPITARAHGDKPLAFSYLQAAAGLDGCARFAALVAPLAQETDGTARFQALCARLRVPNECKDLAGITLKYGHYCQTPPVDAAAWQALLEGADAFRRPARFAQFTALCQGWNPLFADKLQQAYMLSAAIQAQTLIAQGVQGAAISATLREQRQAALAAWLVG
jgi:tRNA nucleotidyltransferase (CCA-adding enzyme)